jgi:hypothetical protein
MIERINCIREELDNIAQSFANLYYSFTQLSAYLNEEDIFVESSDYIKDCIKREENTNE